MSINEGQQPDPTVVADEGSLMDMLQAMAPRMGDIHVVVGGQFGSEAKGHVTAQLASRLPVGSLTIRTGGPNAGHTVWAEGVEYKLRHLPTPAADPQGRTLVALAARSVIDPEVLYTELEMFPELTVYVDPAATILEPDDVENESKTDQMENIGSTRKGIGAARQRRVGRVARTARDLWGDGGSEVPDFNENDDSNPAGRIQVVDVGDLARGIIRSGGSVIVEAAQGYGLGLHTDYYPFTTSADCTAMDALADARIMPWEFRVMPMVWLVLRPYPIRVAGTSGPLEGETTWEELGLPEERTTVTNNVRRVGHWDGNLAARAAKENGAASGMVQIVLTMLDQVCPQVKGVSDLDDFMENYGNDPEINGWLNRVMEATGCPLGAIGTGPDTMVFAIDRKDA